MTFQKNVKKTRVSCICWSPISLVCCQQLVNNKGSIKPVFRGKGNKYNQTCNFGDIFKHCGFAVDNSLRENWPPDAEEMGGPITNLLKKISLQNIVKIGAIME